MPVNIFIADDHAIIRDGLRSLLAGIAGYAVIGEAADGRTTCQRVAELHPDIVIMDIGMPELNGIDTTRLITTANPQVNVIALSMHADLDFVMGMLGAGARGYLLKESAFDELQGAITATLRGEYYLSRQLDSLVIKEFTRSYTRRDQQENVLSQRERQVLQLLAEGCTNKEVAAKLGLAVRSIETYRAQIMEKLDLHSTAELTKFAIRNGLTTLE